MRHVQSMPAGETLPSPSGLANGTTLIVGGVTWHVVGGGWVEATGGDGGGGSTPGSFRGEYYATMTFLPGDSFTLRGHTWWTETGSADVPTGPFDPSEYMKIGSICTPRGPFVAPDPLDALTWYRPGDIVQVGPVQWRARELAGTADAPSLATMTNELAGYYNNDSTAAQVTEPGGTVYRIAKLDVSGLGTAAEPIKTLTVGRVMGGGAWDETGVYRMVTGAAYTSWVIAGGSPSILDIPTIGDLSISPTSVVPDGDTSMWACDLNFDVAVDMSAMSEVVFITDRELTMHVAGPYESAVAVTYVESAYATGPTNADLVSGATTGRPYIDFRQEIPVWEVFYDPNLGAEDYRLYGEILEVGEGPSDVDPLLPTDALVLRRTV